MMYMTFCAHKNTIQEGGTQRQENRMTLWFWKKIYLLEEIDDCRNTDSLVIYVGRTLRQFIYFGCVAQNFRFVFILSSVFVTGHIAEQTVNKHNSAILFLVSFYIEIMKQKLISMAIFNWICKPTEKRTRFDSVECHVVIYKRSNESPDAALLKRWLNRGRLFPILDSIVCIQFWIYN